jgi:hypothetical protein
MSTKAASAVKAAAETSQERIAYDAVTGLADAGSHDLDRLGYCVWLNLSNRKDSLEEAVVNAGVPLLKPLSETVATIRQRLLEKGISL